MLNRVKEKVPRLKKVKASLKGKIVFEVSGINLEKVELKVSSGDQRIVVELDAESLLALLDRLRLAAESVISELRSLNTQA